MDVAQRILIADLDPDMHQLLLAALQAPGRRIDSVHAAQEALDRLASAPYDLVLVDVSMPGGDGLSLLQRVRELRPAARVVVITGATEPENVVNSIRDQAFAYFSKPFAANAVADMVARALHCASCEGDIQVVSARPTWLDLRVRCKMEAADRIVQFLRELAKDLPQAERENMASAFREILVNAIEHGGGSDPEKWVSITYVRTARAIIYIVRDPGSGFSFEELSHAAVSNPVDAPFEHSEVRDRLGMRPGGFGIMLAQHMCDELIYNEAGNETLLIKYLG
jgi:CheY-like chemotaxis protein/anti-sigma regulatory factor (Ser/Thr protein kinase)